MPIKCPSDSALSATSVITVFMCCNRVVCAFNSVWVKRASLLPCKIAWQQSCFALFFFLVWKIITQHTLTHTHARTYTHTRKQAQSKRRCAQGTSIDLNGNFVCGAIMGCWPAWILYLGLDHVVFFTCYWRMKRKTNWIFLLIYTICNPNTCNLLGRVLRTFLTEQSS